MVLTVLHIAWQASLGAPEDGIMTAELLERLYVEQQIIGAGSNVDADQKGSTLTVSPKVRWYHRSLQCFTILRDASAEFSLAILVLALKPFKDM